MTIYADSSFLVSSRFKGDVFHQKAVDYYETRETDFWLWSPWHRVEVANALRQLTRNDAPERALTMAEARALIKRLEDDVRCEYLNHVEADWRDVLRCANEISIANAFNVPCRAADLLHVAYAVELSAELFVSFDDDQLAIAQAAGLKTENPAL